LSNKSNNCIKNSNYSTTGVSLLGQHHGTLGNVSTVVGVSSGQQTSMMNTLNTSGSFINNLPISSIQNFPNASANSLSVANAIPIGPVRTSQGANIIFLQKASGAGNSCGTTTVTSQIGTSSNMSSSATMNMNVGGVSMVRSYH